MTCVVVDVEPLRRMFDLRDGVLYWREVSKFNLYLLGQVAGSLTGLYWKVQIRGRKVTRSHIVFALVHGRWPAEQIDHINWDTLDDRPENLREATQTENVRHTKGHTKGTSLPMGVRMARSGRYVARIHVGKLITIGTFDTPELADAAYKTARATHFGVFA